VERGRFALEQEHENAEREYSTKSLILLTSSVFTSLSLAFVLVSLTMPVLTWIQTVSGNVLHHLVKFEGQPTIF
jgi:hypothetical protein